MFAVAIWSSKAGELFLARDRLGVKPLYISEQRGTVLFASEVRALLASGCIPRRFSPAGVDSFLRFGAPREPHTIIADVTELEPGTWLTVSAARRTAGTFWRMEPPPPEGALTSFGVNTYDDAAARVRDLLRESVRLRLVSDVPVVTFLSGGLDSSCVVAAVREVTGAVPSTIGVTFKEEAYTEAAYMQAVVDEFGCRHTNHELGALELLDLIPIAVRSMDQPTSDGVNTFVVSRAAAESGFKVALSGIGGDELFGGYPSFRAVPLLQKSQRILPGTVGRRLATTLTWALSPGERRKKLNRWFNEHDLQGDAYDLVRELFTPMERELLTGQRAPDLASRGVGHGNLSFGDVSCRELSQYMRNVLLRDTDCFGMACSLEIREPYLHLPLVELLLNLPDAWKARGGRKALLRYALADVLPASVLRGPKRGFLLPFRVWLKEGPLRNEVEGALLDPGSHLLNPRVVQTVWKDFQNGRTSWNRVWALYVLRTWARSNLGMQ
jgi:asparagine synthase (glutamine-hydrolysing)